MEKPFWFLGACFNSAFRGHKAAPGQVLGTPHTNPVKKSDNAACTESERGGRQAVYCGSSLRRGGPSECKHPSWGGSTQNKSPPAPGSLSRMCLPYLRTPSRTQGKPCLGGTLESTRALKEQRGSLDVACLQLLKGWRTSRQKELVWWGGRLGTGEFPAWG